jgi:hypothetical protein
MATLQEVFERHFPRYAEGRKLHPREASAAHSILKCFTAAAGSHIDHCPQWHYSQQTLHACRHRSCPRCAQRPQQRWIEAELGRLLPVEHYHVIFTLPHELLPLWEFNRARFSQLLFDAVRQTLLELMGDPRHLGALPGLLMTLHTWGRTLSHHPHIHALLSAGGVDAQGRWRSTRAGYLLPLKPLQRLYAGKLLGLLGEQIGHWVLPPQQPAAHWRTVRRRLYRAHWNVQINPPYEHGRGVALYLARYAKGGPLPSSRRLQQDDQGVSFDYTDHRDGRSKRLRLDAQEFISRVLWHAPPKGCHTVRHAGLYATARRRQHTGALLSLVSGSAPDAPASPYTSPPACPPTSVPTCPSCERVLLRSYVRPWTKGRSQISSSIQRPRVREHQQSCRARPNPAFKRNFDGMKPVAEAKASATGPMPSNSA